MLAEQSANENACPSTTLGQRKFRAAKEIPDLASQGVKINAANFRGT
jgi:hypothetical protein